MQCGADDMVLYDPIFGISFLPGIICEAERIHITNKNEPDKRSDILDLDSDAAHQSEKSEHPV